MRKLLSFLLTAVLSLSFIWLVGCASSKTTAYDPSGNWNYTVTGTPNGNVDGTLVISKNGDDYTGEIRSSEGNIALENLQIEGQNLTAEFYYSGTDITMNGTFEGDAFNGKVVAGGYDSFDMTATRAN